MWNHHFFVPLRGIILKIELLNEEKYIITDSFVFVGGMRH